MDMYKLSEVLGIESVEIPDELFEFEKTDVVPPTATSFKKGHDNSKAVKAARKAVLGVSQTEVHKRKRAKAKWRPVYVNGFIFPSGRLAAKVLGCSPGAISNKIKRGTAYHVQSSNVSNKGK